jgi:hypothetical protein
LLILPLLLLVAVLVVLAASRAEHALASAFWGFVTVFVFAPAGALLALVVSDHEMVFSGLVIGVVLSGIVTGGALMFLANRLRKGQAAPTDAIGKLTLAHHVAVFAIIGTATVFSGDGAGNGSIDAIAAMIGALATPCAIGGYLGWKLITTPSRTAADAAITGAQ